MFPVASLANLPPLPPLSPFSDHASSRDNPPLSALSFSLLFFYLRLRSFLQPSPFSFFPSFLFPSRGAILAPALSFSSRPPRLHAPRAVFSRKSFSSFIPSLPFVLRPRPSLPRFRPFSALPFFCCCSAGLPAVSRPDGSLSSKLFALSEAPPAAFPLFCKITKYLPIPLP